MSACQAANIQYTNDMHRPSKTCYAYYILIFILTATYVFFQMHACMIALPLYNYKQYVTIDSEVPTYSNIEAACRAARFMHVVNEHF